MTTTGDFECFHHFNFETNFLKNENLFQKTGVPFLVESIKIESATFPHKLPCQKPMLRQIEREVQNGSIKKSGVLLVTTFCFEHFVSV